MLAALAGAILLLLLAGLLPAALLLLARLLLAAALLLAALLTALLLLTGFLVGILVLVHSISFQRWCEDIAAPPPKLKQRTGAASVPPVRKRLSWNPAGLCEVFMERTTIKGLTVMGRYALLWLIGVPVPILVLIWLFGGLN